MSATAALTPRRTRLPARTDLVLAASGGGHIDLLVRVERGLADVPRAWVTTEGTRARSLREQGERVFTVPHLDRHDLDPGNPLQAPGLAARLRPRVIVTSGAGLVLPFVLAARAMGARVIFVETMARVSSPSLSGRMLGRLARRCFVQWPELAPSYRSATVCRPALLEWSTAPSVAGTGTFVSVGTHTEPFDRLLEMVDRAAGAGLLPAPVVAQTGPSTYRPRHFQAEPWMSQERFGREVAAASCIVGHAGSGLVGSALRSGRRPLVLPRRAPEEHVDDHQAQLSAKLDELGLAVRLTDAISPGDVARTREGLPGPELFADMPDLEAEMRRAATAELAR